MRSARLPFAKAEESGALGHVRTGTYKATFLSSRNGARPVQYGNGADKEKTLDPPGGYTRSMRGLGTPRRASRKTSSPAQLFHPSPPNELTPPNCRRTRCWQADKGQVACGGGGADFEKRNHSFSRLPLLSEKKAPRGESGTVDGDMTLCRWWYAALEYSISQKCSKTMRRRFPDQQG